MPEGFEICMRMELKAFMAPIVNKEGICIERFLTSATKQTEPFLINNCPSVNTKAALIDLTVLSSIFNTMLSFDDLSSRVVEYD